MGHAGAVLLLMEGRLASRQKAGAVQDAWEGGGKDDTTISVNICFGQYDNNDNNDNNNNYIYIYMFFFSNDVPHILHQDSNFHY